MNDIPCNMRFTATLNSQVLLTELKIANSEFERFDVALEREVTFCLKELRAILTFQDAVALPLDIYFDDPGK